MHCFIILYSFKFKTHFCNSNILKQETKKPQKSIFNQMKIIKDSPLYKLNI